MRSCGPAGTVRLHVPFSVRRGELQIAVSTGGRSPALAREIRRRLEPAFRPEYAELVERVGIARIRARAAADTLEAHLRAGERLVAVELGGGPGSRTARDPALLLVAEKPPASGFATRHLQLEVPVAAGAPRVIRTRHVV